jgi:integrase/recombinase XerD
VRHKRHTYATYTLAYMRKHKSATDPLLYVRDRLGHSSVSVTERYLHYLDAIEDDLITAYQDEIDNL